MASYRTRTGVSFDDKVMSQLKQRVIVATGNKVTGGGGSVVAIWVHCRMSAKLNQHSISSPMPQFFHKLSLYSVKTYPVSIQVGGELCGGALCQGGRNIIEHTSAKGGGRDARIL